MTELARVEKTKARTMANGKAYYRYRVNINSDTVEALGLKDGDFITIRKPDWVDYLKWEEMPRTWGMLPKETKTMLKANGFKPPEGWE